MIMVVGAAGNHRPPGAATLPGGVEWGLSGWSRVPSVWDQARGGAQHGSVPSLCPGSL